MTDTERLDWLETQDGAALVSDDRGHWAVCYDGMQNCPAETPADIETWFLIYKDSWRNTVREAIDAAKEADDDR